MDQELGDAIIEYGRAMFNQDMWPEIWRGLAVMANKKGISERNVRKRARRLYELYEVELQKQKEEEKRVTEQHYRHLKMLDKWYINLPEGGWDYILWDDFLDTLEEGGEQIDIAKLEKARDERFTFYDLVARDKKSGLVWTKNADLFGMITWERACNAVNELNEKGFAEYNDWRIPTLDEILTLFDVDLNKNAELADDEDEYYDEVECVEIPPYMKIESQGFSSVVSDSYWTSSIAKCDECNKEYEGESLSLDGLEGYDKKGYLQAINDENENNINLVIIDLLDGHTSHDMKKYEYYLWPVRGQLRSIPIQQNSMEKHYAGKTVLIADDDRHLCEILAEFIGSGFPGIRIEITYNGIDALHQIGKNRPSLLILNMMMPGKGGAEVLQELWATKIKLPTFVMSGYVKSRTEVAKLGGVPLNSFEYLAKPFDLSEFNEIIARLLAE